MDEKSEPKVEAAENGLSATLVLPKDFERSSLTPELCATLIKRADVDLESISQEHIEQCIEQAKSAKPGRFTVDIAQATPAVHGIDASIEWQLEKLDPPTPATPEDQPESEDDSPDSDGQGAVSFYDRSIYTVVKAGDVLGQYSREIPGTEGKDVRGKPLAARTAKPLELKYDESIGIDQANNVVAKADGVLIRDGKSARVSDTIEVNQNVDFNTGNIDFQGNILVHRGIKDCFIVKATESIDVRGLIEAATIIAGKDFHAKGGFAGREQGTATVQENLYARYLDSVECHVGGDLCVEREILNCKNTVLGGINSPRGALIGGSTQVSGAVELLELGSNGQPITELQVGVLPQLDPLIAELKQVVEQLVEERQKLLDEQEMITANSGAKIAPTNQEKLNRLTFSLAGIQHQMDRAEPSLEQAINRGESIRQVDVLIHRTMYPNAMLVFAGYHYRITDEIKGPVRITANKRGQLESQSGEGRPALLSTQSDLRTAA